MAASLPRTRGPGLRLAVPVVAAALLLGGCGAFASGGGAPGSTPEPAGSPGSPGTATPGSSGSPDDTASPSSSPVAGSTPATPGAPDSSTSPSAAPVSCTTVTPVRIQKATADPRRTIEVVTLVSDGRNLTPGTREQSDFANPVLTAPDQTTTVTDQATLRTVADLVAASSRNRLLLARPEPPDAGADASRRPYNAPGTYVGYNATSPLTADVIVTCSGQEQRWQLTAESDLTTGQVNCAVEPPKSNPVARLVFSSNC